MAKTKKQLRQELEERIKKGVGAWKVSQYKSMGKDRIGFHNKKGRFITHIAKTPESTNLLRIYSKRVVLIGRIKGFRKPQLFQINLYSQEQADELSKRVRKGLAPIKKPRTKRDIDLLLDKYKYEFISNIKFTS